MNWLDSMGLKHKALPPLMTYPTVPKTLVSIYMATESTMVRVIWLTPYLLFSYVQLIATPWTASLQVSLSFTVSQSLLRLMCIESVMPANHLILCRPLFLLPSIGFFSNESALCIRWPKYWSFSFSFSISPSNEYSGVIPFRID